MPECYTPDTTTYEPARRYLTAAFENILAAGKDVRQLVEFAFEKFGGMFTPYLCQFLCDVHAGRIKIDGLAESAKVAFIGQQVSAAEREAMIREAAYFRAEQRGFTDSSPEQDWLAAAEEVDERLARAAGVAAEDYQALVAAIASAEKELWCMNDVITLWLEGDGGETNTPPTRTAPAQQTVTRKNAVAGKPAPRTNKAQPAKKAADRKAETNATKGSSTAGRQTATKKAGARNKTVAGESIPAATRAKPVKKTSVKHRPAAASKGKRLTRKKKTNRK